MASFKERCIESLNLKPLDGEGGYFRETYRNDNKKISFENKELSVIAKGEKEGPAVDARQDVKRRDLYTTIYYLMEKLNAPVRNASDILHFYHDGCPIRYYWIEEGSKEIKELTVGKGHHLHWLVPGGALKWAVVLDDGVHDACALISECTVPGFCFEDRDMFSEDELKERYPENWDKIKQCCFD